MQKLSKDMYSFTMVRMLITMALYRYGKDVITCTMNKAYHALTNQAQSLLTKPQLPTLALALIRPQNLKGKPKS